MMKIFERRRNIERATMFRVEYLSCINDEKAEYRDFKTIKSLSQWVDRNGSDLALILNRFALIDSAWEPYTTVGKKTLTISELKNIVRTLEDAYKSSTLGK